jgi:creatinine amidohydrolase
MVTGETRLWKLTRRQVREALDAGLIRAAILPTGSTEQHNEHLAMEHDTASAVHVAYQASLELYPRAVVATPIGVGLSEHWMEIRGTLTLKPETFASVAFDICDSLRRHGIEHVLIVNGHAGNGPLGQRMPEFRERLGIDVQFCSYWEAYTPEFVKAHMESGDCPAHAAEFETSFALAAFPENVHWEGVDLNGYTPVIGNEGYVSREPGYFRGARDLATPGKGRVMADEAIRWVTGRVRQMIGE